MALSFAGANARFSRSFSLPYLTQTTELHDPGPGLGHDRRHHVRGLRRLPLRGGAKTAVISSISTMKGDRKEGRGERRVSVGSGR